MRPAAAAGPAPEFFATQKTHTVKKGDRSPTKSRMRALTFLIEYQKNSGMGYDARIRTLTEEHFWERIISNLENSTEWACSTSLMYCLNQKGAHMSKPTFDAFLDDRMWDELTPEMDKSEFEKKALQIAQHVGKKCKKIDDRYQAKEKERFEDLQTRLAREASEAAAARATAVKFMEDKVDEGLTKKCLRSLHKQPLAMFSLLTTFATQLQELKQSNEELKKLVMESRGGSDDNGVGDIIKCSANTM